jgi:hypothetical protein
VTASLSSIAISLRELWASPL